MTDARPKGDLAGSAMTKGRIGITPNRSATVAALLSFGLTGLHRLRRNGARRLRARDIPALLERQDILVLDTETTGIGPYEEAIEIVAIDTTGALRLSALSTPIGRISRRSCEMHRLGKDLLHAMGAQPSCMLKSSRCCTTPGRCWLGGPTATPDSLSRPQRDTAWWCHRCSGRTFTPPMSTPVPAGRTASPQRWGGKRSSGWESTTAPKPTAVRYSASCAQ